MFSVSKKTIASGAIGNIFEVYDYTTWIFFSVYLSKEFLPPESSLADIFFLFLVSYFFRPIGSLACGMLADYYGRKKVLITTIILMGLCTSLITILPSYNQLGFFSLGLLLFIRLIQALSFGGEYISSVTLLIESCNEKHKGFYGSWAAVGVNSGALLATIAGALIAYLINNNILPNWGWRLAFLFSILTMAVGFWIRLSIPESHEFIMYNSRHEKKTFLYIIRHTLFILKRRVFDSLLVITLVWFGTAISFLIFAYVPIYITNFHHHLVNQALIINALSLGILIISIPFFGYLTDIIGRAQVVILGIITMLLFIYPYVSNLSSGNFSKILFSHIAMGIPCASVFAAIPVLITEIFPLPVRCSVANILYSIAACLGGGITPVIAFKLSKNLGNAYLPIYLLVIPAIFSLIFTIFFIKKYPTSLKLVK